MATTRSNRIYVTNSIGDIKLGDAFAAVWPPNAQLRNWANSNRALYLEFPSTAEADAFWASLLRDPNIDRSTLPLSVRHNSRDLRLHRDLPVEEIFHPYPTLKKYFIKQAQYTAAQLQRRRALWAQNNIQLKEWLAPYADEHEFYCAGLNHEYGAGCTKVRSYGRTRTNTVGRRIAEHRSSTSASCVTGRTVSFR